MLFLSERDTLSPSKNYSRKLLPLMISAALGASPVVAETVLEEVIVTSQMRAQSLQDVPISASALSSDKLDDNGIANLEAAAAYVPNFSINQTGISTTISVRGISSGNNQGFEQSVGMYSDGIHTGRAQLARAPMMDLERVEILRGPQSILFGKNSVAGAVSMISAKPTDEFEGSVTALYEPEHGEQDIRLVVSGPLTDNVRGRLAILDRSMDGYTENTFLDEDEADRDEQVIRGTLVWDASEDLTATLKLEKGSFDVKGRDIEIFGDTAAETGAGLSSLYAAFAPTQTLDDRVNGKRQSDVQDTSKNDTYNATLTLDYQVGEHTLTSVTGFTGYEYDELCDCDFTSLDLFSLALDEEYDQFSQEIRIASPLGGVFDYIAGVFYQTSELKFEDNFMTSVVTPLQVVIDPTLAGVSAPREFEQDADLWSVFAQGTWNIDETKRLTLGARFTDEEKTATRVLVSDSTSAANVPVVGDFTVLDYVLVNLQIEDHDLSGDRSETAFTPLVNFQMDVTEDLMAYATFTTGFKSGGFDVRSNASSDPSFGVPGAAVNPLGSFEFEDEEATSFELGAKMTLADGAAEVNVALYHTEYEDLQVSVFDGSLGFNVGNAAKATVQGLELDGRWAISDSLTLSGGLSYLDFEFDDYQNGQCYFGQAVAEPDTVTDAATDACDFTGKRQAATPEWTANLSADYEQPISEALKFRAVVDAIYSDEYVTSPTLDPRTMQDSYVKFNARVSIASTDDQWEVALVAKNLTDEEILTYSSEVPLSSTLTGGAGTAYYGFYERPRSVAVQGTFRF